MSVHPNTILMLVLTPDDLARKTHRAIMAYMKLETEDDDIKILNNKYHHMIMESDYDKGFQIAAKEGDIVVFDLVTYGYGERIKWGRLVTQKCELENWAKIVCEKFHCSYEIFVSANYW